MDSIITCSDVTPTSYSDKFNRIIQLQYPLNPELNNNKIAQAIKFFLLKGRCGILKALRSVEFEPSDITFSNKTSKCTELNKENGNCTSLNKRYIEFYIEEISPFISYTIIEKLKNIYNHNPTINTNLKNNTSQPTVQEPSSFLNRGTRFLQNVTGKTKQIEEEKRISKEKKKLSLQLFLLKETVTLIPGSFSHQRTTNMLGRFYDKYFRNIQQLMESVSRISNQLRGEATSQNIQKMEECISKIQKLKSVFNTLCVGKLLWVDRINPNILPYNCILELLNSNNYINGECLGFLTQQQNRNYLTKFNGLLNDLDNYLNPRPVSNESTPLLTENFNQRYSIYEALKGKSAKQIMDDLQRRIDTVGGFDLEPRIRNTTRGNKLYDYGVRELAIKCTEEGININKNATKYREVINQLADEKYKPQRSRHKKEGGKKKKSTSTKLKSKTKKVKSTKK